MDIELTLDEQTLLALFRKMDEDGRKEFLRRASHNAAEDAPASVTVTGQCRLEREEARPEMVAEPIFTE